MTSTSHGGSHERTEAGDRLAVASGVRTELTRIAPRASRLGFGLAIFLVAGAGAALATPGSGVVTMDIAVGVDDHKVFARTKGASDLHVVSNIIAPGGHTGWHTHPGPSLITVKSGTITA